MSRMRISALFLLAMAAWLMSLTDAESVQAALPDTDIEATRDYIIYNEDRTLMRYDPVTGERRVIVDGLESVWSTFEVNPEGLVAYADSTDGDAEIYVVDSSLENPTPQLLIDRPSTHDRPLAWSRDGRYLAFASELVGNEDDHVWLYVWDGEHAINITPHDLPSKAWSYDVEWGYDGQLAFVVTPGGSQDSKRYSRAYIWHGNTFTKIRLDEENDLYSPRWLRNGSLALSYVIDYSLRYVAVWSDVALQTDQFPSNDAVLIMSYPSAFTVTPDDTFMYIKYGAKGGMQLYEGNSEWENNVSQNEFSNSLPEFSLDGRYAYSTYLSEQHVYVRDKNHNLIWSDEGIQEAWGLNNSLIYCADGWQLSIWNGSVSEVIYSSDPVHATWQKTGQQVICTPL